MTPVLRSSSSGQDLFRAETAPIASAPPDFTGKRVYAAEAALDTDEYAGVQSGWNDSGEMNDVVLTLDSKVDAVLVGMGGFRGLGERQVATDTSQLQTLQAIKGGALRRLYPEDAGPTGNVARREHVTRPRKKTERPASSVPSFVSCRQRQQH